MIKLKNGFCFEFQCGSGALGFDGLGYFWEYPFRWFGFIDPSWFVVVSKTLTVEPTEGNLSFFKPWKCVKLIKNGVINKVGLTNPGIDYWIKEYYPRAKKKKITIAPSFFLTTWEEAFYAGLVTKQIDIPFVELNFSCPSKSFHEIPLIKICRGFAEANPDVPIIAKLSYGQCFNHDLIQEINDEESISALHAINSVPVSTYSKIYETTVSSDHFNEAGISGLIIHELARQAVRSLINLAPDKPIVAGGGIYDYQNLANFHDDGAKAFSIGTLFLKKPWKPNQIFKEAVNLRWKLLNEEENKSDTIDH